jgi:hypothetical protein
MLNSRKTRWGNTAGTGKMTNTNTAFTEKLHGKGQLGTFSRTREDSFKMNLEEMQWESVDSISLNENGDGGGLGL